jgi:TusE/DsrC/DsvC family sulfur relay protein
VQKEGNIMVGISIHTDSLWRDLPQDPDFPHAPVGWSKQEAMGVAQQDNLKLTDEHWQVVRAMQEFYSRHKGPTVNMRELHDALDERFHAVGGIKHLYRLLPAGPIAQGCRLAGLKAPSIATDRSFGSVA